MAKNRALHRASKAQQDEFYTSVFDIENELQYYWPHFIGKKILCNCDDPFESQFFMYFATRFHEPLRLSKLTATCYAGSPIAQRQLSLFEENLPPQERTPYCATLTELQDYNNDERIDYHDVIWALRNIPGALRKLHGDGDFRSDECVELLKDADVVVTNPPFSLLREYIALLMKYHKKFVIVGNINAITYKEIFPLFMQNRMWFGYGFNRGSAHFTLPSIVDPEETYNDYDPKTGLVSMRNCCWFTNLEIRKRKEEIVLYKHYTPEEYPHYDNYDAIEVSRVDLIPCDYWGVMGVPITFLQRYNPEQFEIVGRADANVAGEDNPYHIAGFKDKGGAPMINGRFIYKRILIRRRNGEDKQYSVVHHEA